MFKPEDEIIPDLSISCTKEVAVAKLLGWMKGHRRAKVIEITEHGIPEEQLPFLYTMQGTLQEQLYELRESARQGFLTAAQEGAAFEVLEEKEQAVNDVDSLIDKAFMYLTAIGDELSKGEESALKIDEEATEQTGITHITLTSLDNWAMKNHGISILGNKAPDLPADKKVKPSPTPDIPEDLDISKGMKPRDAESFFTTFAFLVDAFHKVALEDKTIKFGEGRPNVLAIAKHIEELARAANNGKELPGQKEQSIKKRINRAMEARRNKLPQR